MKGGVTKKPRVETPPQGGDPLAEQSFDAIAAANPEGLSAAQIVEVFLDRGVKLSEATFRKWVQLGLLPRSRRVGRKGKHQGSRGLYPASALRRIAAIKRLMAENLTIEDIQRALRWKEQIDALRRGFGDLFNEFAAAAGDEQVAETSETGRLIAESRRAATELVQGIEGIERRIVAPLLRAAKARAFGTGSGGAAGELL